MIATHSTEIITEAEAEDIVLIDKRRSGGRRITNPAELQEVFTSLGSNLNPILTQLAKTKRVVFVEGKDFQIIAKFAERLGHRGISTRSAFAVVPIGGFNPDRIKSLKDGMETTLGMKISAAAVLDRDFRSAEECAAIIARCKAFCDYVQIHSCKEVKNFLLVPQAIDRAISRRVADRIKRGSQSRTCSFSAVESLERFIGSTKSTVTSQYLARRRQFERSRSSSADEATANKVVLDELEKTWADSKRAMQIVEGKAAFAALNTELQQDCGVSVTPTSVIAAMTVSEIPSEMRSLIEDLSQFAMAPVPGA